MSLDDSNRYFGVDEIIKQNNEAYLKGVGFVTAPEDTVFTPSSAKPEQGWGVHGPKETKGGRTKTEEWETIGSSHLESDLVMDKNTKAIFRRVDSALKIKEAEIKAQLSQITQKLAVVEKDVKDLNRARFSQSVNILAEDLDKLKESLEDRHSKIDIGINSALTKEAILRKELNEKISRIDEAIKKLEDDVNENIEGPELAYLKACSLEEEFKLIKQSYSRELSYLKDTIEAIKRQTAFCPEFERFKTMSNHRISELEITIKSLQDQISTLQNKKNKPQEQIVFSKEESQEDNIASRFTLIVIAVIIFLGLLILRASS